MNTETDLTRKVPTKGYVYVCFGCGRCSCDPAGLHALSPGWSQSCSRQAIRLEPSDVQLDLEGRVLSVRKEAIASLRGPTASLN